MTINSNLPPQIHKAQVESLKTEKVKDENLHGMDKELRLVLIELPALGSIPCSPECKIVGQILLDHPLSYDLLDHPLNYDLTATADVPAVYLQQFWRTVSKVLGPEETVKVGYQGVVDKTKINILQLFHAVINQTNFDYAALLWWDFMSNVKQKKEAIHYPRFIKLIIADLMNKFPDIPKRIDEDYHSIKDDIPLVSVYTIGDVRVQGMLIPDAFLNEEIHATDDFKEYKTVFMQIDVTINQPQLVVSTEGTHQSTPRAHRTPTLTVSPQGKKRKKSAGESSSPMQDEVAEATILSLTLHKTALAAEVQENIAKVQEKLDEEEIDKMVDVDEDEESYASVFADLVLNDDVDDSGTRLEPGSHKENLEKVNDDDAKIEKDKDGEEIEKEKKDEEIEKEMEDDRIETDKTDEEIEKEKKVYTVEEMNEVVKEKDIVDDVTGSMEIKKEHKQTLISSPTRFPRNVSSSDKTVSEELTATVSPTSATTSKAKRKTQSISFRSKTLPGKTLDHCNKIVPDVTFAKTKEMIIQEMPCLVNLEVNKDRKVDHINAKEMIAKEFTTHVPKMIEELF
ncbi:hypothetical protein Tco_1080030 [Tanacetum coccineum]|uniref:Uncharacterized protein n=1 Tax=Tanacetum coccineum TaxID=301880 RepID=A0ABQ5HV31_9ASTR